MVSIILLSCGAFLFLSDRLIIITLKGFKVLVRSHNERKIDYFESLLMRSMVFGGKKRGFALGECVPLP
jgi:hypothetical protein